MSHCLHRSTTQLHSVQALPYAQAPRQICDPGDLDCSAMLTSKLSFLLKTGLTEMLPDSSQAMRCTKPRPALHSHKAMQTPVCLGQQPVRCLVRWRTYDYI